MAYTHLLYKQYFERVVEELLMPYFKKEGYTYYGKEEMVDFSLILNQAKEAAKILKWAEDCFQLRNENWEPNDNFLKRKERVRQQIMLPVNYTND